MDIGKLSATYRNEKSFNGYGLSELKSALQKYIRRSNPVRAIYAGLELDLFALIGAEGIRTNFIHRLMVIFMEDVRSPEMWPWIDKMIFELLSLREKRKTTPSLFEEVREKERRIVPRVVYALAVNTHSRENSFYNFVFRNYFLQSSELREKIRSRFPFLRKIEKSTTGIYPHSQDFSAELTEEQMEICSNFMGCLERRNEMAVYYAHQIVSFDKLSQKFYKSTSPVYLLFHLIEKTLPIIYDRDSLTNMKEYLQIAMRWYRELTPLKEEFLCWQYLILIIIKNRKLPEFRENESIARRLHLMYKRNLNKMEMEFADYVYDMHTREGKAAGKSSTHFALVSSLVKDEDPEVNLNYKNAYTYYKLITDTVEVYDEPELENEYFTVEVRAQLVTGNGKTDTYFAMRRDGKLMFVKGPFENDEIVNQFIRIQLLKKKMGLTTINYEVVHLKPNLFSDSPLGLRHRLSAERLYPFLMCKPIFNFKAEEIPRKSHSSKVWPATEVVDWSKIGDVSHLTLETLQDERLMRDYIENVVFRYVFGVGDLAKRNFLIYQGRILSIDEDLAGRDFSLSDNLRDIYPLFLKYVEENREWFRGILEKYSSYLNQRLENLKNL